MNKHLQIIIFLLLIFTNVFPNDFQKYIDSGDAFYKKRNYKEALVQYHKALKIDPNNIDIYYKLSLTYLYKKTYLTAVKYADKILKMNSKYKKGSYSVKGLGLKGKYKIPEAIEVFKEGLKEFPNEPTLKYNIASCYFYKRKNKKTEYWCLEALKNQSDHDKTLILMGAMYYRIRKKTKCTLSLLYYLLYHPKARLAQPSWDKIEDMFMDIDDENINDDDRLCVTINAKVYPGNRLANLSTYVREGESIEFNTMDMVITYLAFYKNHFIYKDKKDPVIFVENMTSFFRMLEKLRVGNKGYWWDVFADFYIRLLKAGHVEAFCYYIRQVDDIDEVNIKTHQNDQ